MLRLEFPTRQISSLLAILLVGPAAVLCSAEQPTPAATAWFDAYTQALEARLTEQDRSPSVFLPEIADARTAARLRNGELILENRTPADASVSGALLHDWRGTTFVPGATAADFEQLMRDYNAYPQHYAPEIVTSRVLSHHGDEYQVELRLHQKHVITVVLDTNYDVSFGRLDARDGHSVSRSTRVVEIADPGTPREHPLSAAEEHGYLWRINIYWSYEQRDGGVYMQMETVTLTRSIPTGLGWLVGAFVNRAPRDSLEFMLRATRKALWR